MNTKKLISLALCLLMLVSAFVGCAKDEEEVSSSDLANAKAYLINMYQTGDKDETMELLLDKDFLSVVTIDGVAYDVEWSVTVKQGASDEVKVVESDKENHVKIDVPELPETDVLFTATAVIKDAEGNTEAANFNYKVTAVYIPGMGDESDESDESGDASGDDTASDDTSNDEVTAPDSQTAIVDEAYALEKDTALPYTATLTGKVISVDDAYSAEFENITVTIQVAGREDKPIKCYRMKGNDIDKLAKGDTIIVTGTIKNYNGTIEFDLGCVMKSRIAGGGEPIKQETDPERIVAAAFALNPGEDLGYDVTLTGKVTKLQTAYDPSFKNVSVVILVSGKEILCYRMKGDEADKILVGDTITVTGRIKNYNGTIEFDTGCTMRKRVSGGATVLTDPVEIVNAAYALEPGKSLAFTATLTGVISSIDTPYSSQYNNITVTIKIAGCEDKPIKCFRLKGDGADALAVGDTITVTGIIKNYQHSSGDCEIEFDYGCTFIK